VVKRISLVKAAAALLLVSIAFQPNQGMWMRMEVEVPVDRLLGNAAAYIKQNPKDAQGYYVLGRLHSLAFARETKTLEVTRQEKEKLPGFPPWDSIIVRRSKQDAPSKLARNHLLESVRNYRRSTELAPQQPMAFLGLGWMLESGAAWARQLGPAPGEKNSTADGNAWKESALKAYRKAYALSIGADLKRGHIGPGADSAISLEAGQGILRILSARKTSSQEMEEAVKVRESIARLETLPRAVTPIIFSLDRNASLDDLLADKTIVHFDLDGDGEAEWWPWVKPDTGILVWDPERTGRVESGLQLFGSVTWWIGWQHGYQPLAMLDDNRDCWLSGAELDGLAVWRDRNGNGISERGEVAPLQSLGVNALAATAVADRNGVFFNPQGIRLNDGSFLPTYDWTPTEAGAAFGCDESPRSRLVF
jgi:hypothetical protein